jgi:CNT family concentrative nucleoside transporter
MQAIVGVLLFVALAYLLSENRRGVAWRAVAVGIGLQFLLAVVLLKVPVVSQILLGANKFVVAIEAATTAGTVFLFGFLGGGDVPFLMQNADEPYLLAFRVLPQIIIFSVIVAVLWHWRILPLFVKGLGWLLRKTMRVGGAVGTAGAASLFLGMVEAPLVIRAYLARLSRGELFTVMTLGMSTVAGTMLVLYASVLQDLIPGIIGHIITASLINIVGAIYISRLMIPGDSVVGETDSAIDMGYISTVDAITRGTRDGLMLAVNVGAMLLVLISLVALVNGLLSGINAFDAPMSLERGLGWLFAPVAWLLGIPWSEAPAAGTLLGTKLVLNELIAYIQLVQQADSFSPATRQILLYALCGFANLGSLGILLGGLAILVPERREEVLQIAPRSIVSGTLVTLITAALVGLIGLI